MKTSDSDTNSSHFSTDHRLQFLEAMMAELRHAYSKHGSDPWGRHEFYGVLVEEVDELWDAIKKDEPIENVLKEAMQVAAVCLRYAETPDRYRGVHPLPLPSRSEKAGTEWIGQGIEVGGTTLKPWSDETPLHGSGLPENTRRVDWLISYLLTVRKRFGNTACVVDGLKWGAAALWAMSDSGENKGGDGA